jgi:LEA14-like dessication related protein
VSANVLDSGPFRTNEIGMSLRSSLRAASVSLVLVISACSGLGRPSVTPKTPEVKGISTSGLELGVDLQVDNPNPFPLVANEVKGTLFLAGDKKVGTGSAKLDEAIDAKASGNVASRLDIAWSSAGALKEFVGKSTVPYTFKGELGVSGGPVNVSVPFELRGELHRDQLAALGGSLLAPLLR